jgi:hypothetical protein
MNPCHKYLNDYNKIKKIDIRNEDEINFIKKDCLDRIYRQILNTFINDLQQFNRMSNQKFITLKNKFEAGYNYIINEYLGDNITNEFKKFFVLFCTENNCIIPEIEIGPKMSNVINLFRQKLKEYDEFQISKNVNKNERERIKRYRQKHKTKFKPVLEEIIPKSEEISELLKFKRDTGWTDGKRSKSKRSKSKRRSKRRISKRSKSKRRRSKRSKRRRSKRSKKE